MWAQRTLFEHSRKRLSVIVGYYDGRIPFSTWITRINLLCECLFTGGIGVDCIALLMLASNVGKSRPSGFTHLLDQPVDLVHGPFLVFLVIVILYICVYV